MNRAALAALVLVACSKSAAKPDDTPPARNEMADLLASGAKLGKQYATAPQVKTPGVARAFKFTVALPAGAKSETSGDYTTYELGNPLTGIGVTVRFYDDMLPSSSIPFGEDAAERAIVRNEPQPDGGHLRVDARKDHEFFELELQRKIGGAIIGCSVIQRTGTGSAGDLPIEDLDTVLKWAEAVCRSVAPA